MKIYNSIVIDIGTGAVLSEDSFEYSGPVILCKGSSAPIILPDPTEQALNAKELELIDKQLKSAEEMEPFILESMGYGRNADTGKIEKLPDKVTPESIMLKKNLAMSGYDEAGNKLTEEQMLGYMTDQEKATYNLTKANNERTLKAYNGELEISPALEEELEAEEAQATEMLQRKLGPDWALSTSGQSLMKQIKQKGNLVREEARRGQITSGEGIAQSQANRSALNENNNSSLAQLSQSTTNNKINQMMGYINGTSGVLDNSLTMSSKLASDRANIQNSQMQSWATRKNNETSMINGGMSMVGMVGGAAAAAAAAA